MLVVHEVAQLYFLVLVLASVDTSFGVWYPCRTGVLPLVSCYNFSEIARVAVSYPCPVSVLPKLR